MNVTPSWCRRRHNTGHLAAICCHDAYENPESVGKCLFFSLLEDELVGFGSYMPKSELNSAIIGHNCVLSHFRGSGFGTQQILEIVGRFQEIKLVKAVVTTGDHAFFVPAQKMYLACGFTETRRYAGGPDPRYQLIEYERAL